MERMNFSDFKFRFKGLGQGVISVLRFCALERQLVYSFGKTAGFIGKRNGKVRNNYRIGRK